jgi:hypothetical protein
MKKIKSIKNSIVLFTFTVVTIFCIYSCNENSFVTNVDNSSTTSGQITLPYPPAYVYVKQNGDCNSSSIAYVYCYDLTDGSKSSAWTNSNGVATFGILAGHQWTASATYSSHYGCTPNPIMQNEGGSIGTLCLNDLQCKW